MALFDRIRRTRTAEDGAPAPLTPVAAHLLPGINQRITVTTGEHSPVSSRVEDLESGCITLAMPALAVEAGDAIVATWEQDNVWFSLESRVLSRDERGMLPTMQIAAGGRLSRFDERRTDVRREVTLPLELRVVRARAIRPGRELHTETIEISGTTVRFATSASFAPGDTMEAKLQLGEGPGDVMSARLRVIRVDSVGTSWRSTCTAAFDEILRSDRARMMALADAAGREPSDPMPQLDELTPPPAVSTPPTLDGVGGRDEPTSIASMHAAVEWLRRRA